MLSDSKVSGRGGTVKEVSETILPVSECNDLEFDDELEATGEKILASAISESCANIGHIQPSLASSIITVA